MSLDTGIPCGAVTSVRVTDVALAPQRWSCPSGSVCDSASVSSTFLPACKCAVSCCWLWALVLPQSLGVGDPHHGVVCQVRRKGDFLGAESARCGWVSLRRQVWWLTTVSVCLGCCGPTPQTPWEETRYPQLWTWTPRSGCRQFLCLERACCLVHRWCLLVAPSHMEGAGSCLCLLRGCWSFTRALSCAITLGVRI